MATASGRGGTGRRAGFRSRSLRGWRFESSRPHSTRPTPGATLVRAQPRAPPSFAPDPRRHPRSRPTPGATLVRSARAWGTAVRQPDEAHPVTGSMRHAPQRPLEHSRPVDTRCAPVFSPRPLAFRAGTGGLGSPGSGTPATIDNHRGMPARCRPMGPGPPVPKPPLPQPPVRQSPVRSVGAGRCWRWEWGWCSWH